MIIFMTFGNVRQVIHAVGMTICDEPLFLVRRCYTINEMREGYDRCAR